MSKYDNLFKNTYNSDKTTKPPLKNNIFLSKDANDNTQKDTKFNYKEELFPDLSVNKVVSTNNDYKDSKNYASITATVNEVKKIYKNPVLPGWIQYSKSNTKKTIFFDVKYGDKTKRQIEQEQNQKEEEELLNDPVYIHNKTMSVLAKNWNKYKQQYDELHGEGAYDLIYYTEPIYPSLDNNLSDDEKESNHYSSEEEYNSHYNYNDYEKY
jgi:hypothetical protein